jgi:pimeloyl-ACP methyl ester carboxylesterase
MTTMLAACETSLLQIAYKVGGPRDGRPALMLHGWPDDASTYDAVAPRLHDAGFRTYAPWLRGFGATRFKSADTIRSGEIAALTQDALEFADVIGLQRFTVIGHDWGARIAYLLACAVPERLDRCVALSVAWQPGDLPTPGFAQVRAFWYQWFMATDRGAAAVRAHAKDFARAQWDSWGPTGWFDDAAFDAVAKSFENPDWVDITLHGYRVRWGEADPDPRYAELAHTQRSARQIAVPTLQIHGGDDRCVLPAGVQASAPHFSRVYEQHMLDGIGHFPTREAPGATADLILRFLA